MVAALARRLAAREIHYGWVMVAVTFVTMLVTAGAMGAPGVMMVPLQEEFGWSAEQVSVALAVRLALFGLIGPFAAAFMNRFGLRAVTFVALGLIASGATASLFMTELWHLLALWGVVVGVGTGLTALVLGATVATRWFNRRRGLVVGMLTASSATGQLVFLPLLASLTERFGWRAALAFVVVLIVLTLLFVLTLMRDRPADVGLAAYGDDRIVPAPTAADFRTMLVSPFVALRDAAGTQVFWVLFGTFFICGLSTNGLVQTHFIALCGDLGMAAVTAAGVLAVIGIFDFFGTLGSGWLSDRYDNRWLLFWFYGLRGLSLVYLPFSGFSVYALGLFAIFYGLDWVATVPPTVKMAAERFGPERANLVFGWVFAGHQLGAATAAYGAGFIRTEFDSYLPAFFFAGAACLVAAGLVLTLGRPGKEPVGLGAAAAA